VTAVKAPIRASIVALACAALVRADAQPAPGPYHADARRAHLARALTAARALGPDGRAGLERALYDGGRARCRATTDLPAAACMIDLARAECATRGDRGGCHAFADAIIVNQRAETEVVDRATRMRVVAGAADYHAGMLAEVAKRHAVLAADFVVAGAAAHGPGDAAALAARIDRFCAARGAAPDYQRCAAALVWYIATEESP
jgi:hypothetical protein